MTLWCKVADPTPAGNHEEESEIVFGDDTTYITGCKFPGSDGSTPDCARSFVCVQLWLRARDCLH